jgi:stage V sporulation protein AF
MLILLIALFDVWGFLVGIVLILVLLLTNRSVNGDRSYLYPLIPFDGDALLSLFVRRKKRD